MTRKITTSKPPWLKVRLPGGERYQHVRDVISRQRLHTVCEEARCPNVGECWGSGTATFLILGDTCTRGCAFCAVSRSAAPPPPDEGDPDRVAEAVREMGIRYAVVTSVTRDDLPDHGAGIYGRTVAALKGLEPPPLVELLVPDFDDRALAVVLAAGPDVLAHNIEVVERLTPEARHPAFTYRRSLNVLSRVKALHPETITKSSILLGLGETDDEVTRAMEDLRAVGVDILVLGQYLRPTRANAAVKAYVTPGAFEAWRAKGERMGFAFVAASPLARTSYKAEAAYRAAVTTYRP